MPYTVRARLRQRTAVLAALLVVVTGLQSAAAPAEYPFSAQIVFGYGEAPPARWTGSIRAENTRITKIKGWLFRNEDRISYEYPGAPRAPRSAEDKPIGGYREEGFLWSAYRKGYRLGTIASSDHWSTHISYAMFYTGEPARESIFEAIKKRRTYGATDNIVLDYRMGDSFMGEALTTSRIPPLKIHVAGTSPIARIDIIRNEAVIYTGKSSQKEVAQSYLDEDPQPGAGYYYVRIVQDDREIAWGSPIWVKLQPEQ